MVAGVVLAGGENRRMNQKMKALLSFGGEPMIERQLAEMQDLCAQRLIVANRPGLFAYLEGEANVISDQMPGKGPLAGMDAAMSSAGENLLWVVACDMPYISANAAWMLLDKLEDHDAAIPVIAGRVQPLHGIYHRRTGAKLRAVMQNGKLSVQAFLDVIDWYAVEEGQFQSQNIDPRFIMNVNTPEDYEAALCGAGR